MSCHAVARSVPTLAIGGKTTTLPGVEFLEENEWRERAAAFAARTGPWLREQSSRAQKAEKHAVFDFLSTYYSFKPSQLRNWSPGINVRLRGAGAAEFLKRKFFARFGAEVGVCASALPPSRIDGLRWISHLLAITQNQRSVPSNAGHSRASRNTPAFTIVAEWR